MLVMARVAVSVMFFLNGFLISAWLSRIPTIRETLRLSESGLANALVFMTLGALIGFPLVGWMLGRFGSRIATTVMSLSLALILPGLGLANTFGTLALALLVFGIANGAMDVSMNAQAVALENKFGKPIINSFHAIWSVGTLVGTWLGGRMADAALTPTNHFFVVAALSFVLALVFVTRLLPASGTPSGTKFALPPKPLLLIGTVAFLGAMGEGAMADWSGVYLRSSLGTSEAFATNGFVATSLAMIAARFSGDALVARFGPAQVVRVGGAIVATGMAFALGLGTVWAALFGFACVGIGLAVIFPLTFSAAGRVQRIPQGVALASVSTMGYSGFLVGPIVIGYLAEAITLRGSLGALVLIGAVAAFLANAMQPKNTTRA